MCSYGALLDTVVVGSALNVVVVFSRCMVPIGWLGHKGKPTAARGFLRGQSGEVNDIIFRERVCLRFVFLERLSL